MGESGIIYLILENACQVRPISTNIITIKYKAGNFFHS